MYHQCGEELFCSHKWGRRWMSAVESRLL